MTAPILNIMKTLDERPLSIRESTLSNLRERRDTLPSAVARRLDDPRWSLQQLVDLWHEVAVGEDRAEHLPEWDLFLEENPHSFEIKAVNRAAENHRRKQQQQSLTSGSA